MELMLPPYQLLYPLFGKVVDTVCGRQLSFTERGVPDARSATPVLAVYAWDSTMIVQEIEMKVRVCG
jgi:hypothetical protein